MNKFMPVYEHIMTCPDLNRGCVDCERHIAHLKAIYKEKGWEWV